MQDYSPNQEIFDTVAKHLLTQKKRSDGPMQNCLYRSKSGLKCAIGCLIPDEKYSPSFEGMSIRQLDKTKVLPAAYQGVSLAFLGGLQRLHDAYPPSTWNTRLYLFAALNNLSPAVVLSFTKE